MIIYVLRFEKDGKDMIYSTEQYECIQVAIDDVLSDGISFEVECLHEYLFEEEK